MERHHTQIVTLLALVACAAGLGAAQGPGEIPAHRADETPGLAKTSETARTGKRAERLLDMAAPTAWARGDYTRDRAAYCAEVVPGRFHQVKPGGPGVATIEVLGNASPAVKPGAQVKLRFQAAADSPLTVISTGGGEFLGNKLTCITVPTDAQGRAEVVWVATAGTTGDVPIAASCPENAGHAYVHITVGE